MKKTGVFIVLLLISLGAILVGCSSDNDLASHKDEMSTILLSFGMRNSTGNAPTGLVECRDPEIKSVRIMVFSSGGVVEYNKLFTEIHDTPYKATCRVGKGKMVYVVANEEANTMTSQLENIIFSRELQKVIQPAYQAPAVKDEDENFPKILVGKSSVDVNEGGHNSCSIELRRAYSKIVLDLTKTHSEDEVKIKSITFANLSSSSQLFESDPIPTTDQLFAPATPLEFSQPKEVPLEVPKEVSPSKENFLKSYYVYEQCGHSNIDGKALKMQIKATYKGVPTTYTAYINDKGNYQINRNTIYNVKGKISSMGEDYEGFIVTTTVKDWETQKVKDFIVNPYAEGVYFRSKEYGMVSKEYINGVTVIDIRKGSPVYISLTLLGNDNNSKWKASISDAMHFSIDETEGDLGYVKIKVNANYSTGSEYRYCDLQFTCEGRLVDDKNSGKPLVIKFRQI